MSPTDSRGDSVGKDENSLFSHFSFDHELDLEKEMKNVLIDD